MRKIKITISDKQYKMLIDMTRRKKTSFTDAVEECIEYYRNSKLIVSKKDVHNRVLSMAGKYDSGLEDHAKNHDKYINSDICDI